MLGLKIFNNIPDISRYKPLLTFVAKVLGLFFAFLLLKFIHRSLVDPSNNFILSTYLRELNIYSLMADAIIYPSEVLLKLLGYDTITSAMHIAIVGAPRGIVIHAPCLGVDVFCSFIALIISYPSKVKPVNKALFIVSGIIMIHLLNILRVSALAIKNNYSYELSLNHHDLFNIVIYGFVLILFYIWIKYYSKSAVDVTKE